MFFKVASGRIRATITQSGDNGRVASASVCGKPEERSALHTNTGSKLPTGSSKTFCDDVMRWLLMVIMMMMMRGVLKTEME